MIFGSPTGITPYWFLGEVVDKDDIDANAGRVRVRAFGIHPEPDEIPSDKNDLNVVEDQDLPWAPCINGTYGKMNAVPEVGDWVFGFFADGRSAQHPFILGTIEGANLNSSGAIPGTGTLRNRVEGIGAAASGDTGDGAVSASSQNGYDRVSAEILENDTEFQNEFARLQTRYPSLTKDQIYRVIQGESSFDPTAVNRNSGATGLFQFIPSTAKGLGYNTEEIVRMSPAQQLRVYGQYLDSNNYQGGPLGIMQAAPAYADKSGSTEVYARDTAAWRQNPGWRGSDGRITVDSINRYYGY